MSCTYKYRGKIYTDLNKLKLDIGAEETRTNSPEISKYFEPAYDLLENSGEVVLNKYANHYIAWFRDTSIVRRAIKKWGSEEALVKAIGEQSIKQKGEAWQWWKDFLNYMKNLFNNMPSREKVYIKNALTDAFLSRQDLEKGNTMSSERVKELMGRQSGNTETTSEIYSKLGNKTASEHVIIDNVNGRKPAVESNVELFKGFWSRQQVESQTDKVFLFGDNFEDAKTGYVPSSTQAVIRGLPNAIGISTKRDRFTNENLENSEYKIAVKEANSRPSTTNIPQNLVSGVESYGTLQYANNEAIKLLGENPTSIDMIDAGIRTRTTRTDKELEKYNIKVGSYIKMFGKSSNGTIKNLIVKITKITKGYDDVTWYKEGWTQEGLQKLKAHTNTANAVEFEVIKPTKSSYLSDSDFGMFKQHVDEQIQKAKDSGKTIVLPEDGIGTGKAMLKEKAPKLFKYLQQELNKLKISSENKSKDNIILNRKEFQSFAEKELEKNPDSTIEEILEYYKKCKSQ